MRHVPGGALVGPVMQWKKFTVAETAFTAAATSESITLFTLAAGELIHAVKIKHSVAFSGGALSAWTVEVGISGDSAKYAAAFDTFQAVAATTFQATSVLGSEDHGSGTIIEITARSAGDDVLDATAGSVDVWVLISKAT